MIEFETCQFCYEPVPVEFGMVKGKRGDETVYFCNEACKAEFMELRQRYEELERNRLRQDMP